MGRARLWRPGPAGGMVATVRVTPTRIPSLDGLRGAGLLCVLLAHLSGTVGFPRGLGALILNPYLDIPQLALRVFFVISGFLITGLLLAEEEKTGRIQLGQFYLRRTFRIMPAYWVYVGGVAILAWLGFVEVTARDFLHAATYTVNYQQHPSWGLGQLWSLAVEEQFYLLWPLTLVLAGRRRATLVAVGAVCIAPWFRLIGGLDGLRVGHTFETTCDALALGCLLALWRQSLARWPMLRAWWVAPLCLAGNVVAGTYFYRLGMLTQDSFANFAAAAIVLRCVDRPETRVGRVLNSHPFVLLGTVSYSVYLWQQPFLNRYSTDLMTRFPLNLLLALGCGVASYVLIEGPARAQRKRADRVIAWLATRVQVSRPHAKYRTAK